MLGAEKENINGKMAEVSLNWFAIPTRTSDAFYAGGEMDCLMTGSSNW